MRVAVFGGSFNPPHLAHVMALAYVRCTLEVDELLVVPCYCHPFAKELAPFEDRLSMCKLAMGWIPGVSVSTVERELGGESRTLRTLQFLRSQRPLDTFRLVIGSDVLGDVSRWAGFDQIRAIAPEYVLGRVGYEHETSTPSVLPPLSSTAVRQAIAVRDWELCAQWIPRDVLSWIREHGLYGPLQGPR